MSDAYDADFQHPNEKFLTAPLDPDRPRSGLAVVSLVFGILGFVPLPLIGSIIALVTGKAAMGQIREEGGRVGGKEMARVGIMLGTIQMVFLALVAGLLYFFLIHRYETSTPTTASFETVKEVVTRSADPGVKMVNEMGRDDYRLIEQKLPAEQGQIIACYNAGRSDDDPEFALLTTQAIAYVKNGRWTSFNLKEVSQVKDDKTYEAAYNIRNGVTYADFDIYHIEIQLKTGPRMRIEIQPEQQGPIFFDALTTALEAQGVRVPPAGR